MENKQLLRVALVLGVCFTIHITSGSRNESFEVGNNITLLCTNERIAMNKMIYVVWKINSQEKNCTISVASTDPGYDDCNDGKWTYINESGNYSLIIPSFSIKDEGQYICDLSYQGGGYLETIHVSAYVRPKLTGWLEKEEDGHTFAVCEAQSKPAASIYWKTQGNISSSRTSASKNASGLLTVTSRLQLPHNPSTSDLTCVVSASPPNYWEETQFNTFQYKDPPVYSITWPFILMGVIATCSFVIVLTGLYIMREKIGELSVSRKLCCTPQIPTPAREVKTPQPRDLEEVEPYASYVQRVNSIYNSSAELFNA